jgi:hypothetical protein
MAVRRVVTGVAAEGTSRFVSDGPPACVQTRDDLPGVEVTYVWTTDHTPRVDLLRAKRCGPRLA